MRGYRKFKLVNSRGEIYDLMDKSHYFHNPAGIGFTSAASYTRVANSFVPVGDRPAQTLLSGSIFFGGQNAYEEYAHFSQFCQWKPLELIYETYRECRIKVNLTQTVKGEKSASLHGLEVDIRLTALSMWYRLVSVSNDGSVGLGKVYEERQQGGNKIYAYAYDYHYADELPGVVTIESDTALLSPCIITIYGPVTDPVWRRYLNGVLQEQGAVSATIPAGNKLLIDTTTIPFRIIEADMSNQIIADRYQDSDFSLERFIYLENGRNRIVVGGRAGATPAVTVEAQLSYETV